MKKIVSLLLIATSLFITEAAHSQTRTVTVGNIKQGTFVDFGGINLTPIDSLQVSDSIAYLIPITHENALYPYHIWYWQKSGSGTATVTVNFFQGNDPTNLFPVKAGVAQNNYTKTYTLSSSTWSEIDFRRDTANFSGRYLKVQFITSSTPSVKGYVFNRLKTSWY